VFGAHRLTTTRADGDFRIDAPADELAARRRAVIDLPWVWLRQVHGADVLLVDDAAAAPRVAGREGDALVTRAPGVVLAVQTADCGPVVLASPEGVIGVAHAGWRGLVAGVVERTVDTMRSLGATTIVAELGPCIGPECYEFGADDLRTVVRRFGPEVEAATAQGRPALDVRAAARQAAAARDVPLAVVGACVACERDGYYSHRARQEQGRMATIVWHEGTRHEGTRHEGTQHEDTRHAGTEHDRVAGEGPT
jgi:YfiH family protein